MRRRRATRERDDQPGPRAARPVRAVPELPDAAHRAASRRGELGVRRGRQAVPRLHRRHRHRQRRARQSPRTRGADGAGEAPLARVQPVRDRAADPAGGEADRADEDAEARLLLQQRYRGERGDDQAGPPLPCGERTSGADRDPLLPQLLPRPHARISRRYRPAQVPAGVWAPARGLPLPRVRERRRARGRQLGEDLRRDARAHPGRGGSPAATARVSREGARAVHQARRPDDPRRGADRHGAHRRLLRPSARAHRAGCHDPCQGHRRGSPPRRAARARGRGEGLHARHPRQHLRRQSAGHRRRQRGDGPARGRSPRAGAARRRAAVAQAWGDRRADQRGARGGSSARASPRRRSGAEGRREGARARPARECCGGSGGAPRTSAHSIRRGDRPSVRVARRGCRKGVANLLWRLHAGISWRYAGAGPLARRGNRLGAAETSPGGIIELPADMQNELLQLEARGDRLTHYELLGVGADADARAVRRAYLEKSKRFHPDAWYRKETGKFGPLLSKWFQRLSTAYQVLSDEEMRAGYDRDHRAELSQTDRVALERRELSVAEEERRARERRERLLRTKGFARIGAARKLYEEALESVLNGERTQAIFALKAARG